MTGGRPIHDPACRLHPEPFPGAWARARCWLALHGQVAVLPLHCTDRLSRIIHPLPPLKRNERLFEGGDTGGNLYIVYSGSLRTSVQQADGDEQVVDFHLPGEIAGDGTGLETFRGSRAVALERTRICAVRLTSLRNLAMQYSDLQEQVYAVLERAKAHTEKHTLMMGWRRADERIALFLHDWWQRRQRAGFPGQDLYLPMRREDLASYLGLVPETASRSMSRLRELGIIDLPNHYNVRILDREQLARLARIDPPSD